MDQFPAPFTDSDGLEPFSGKLCAVGEAEVVETSAVPARGGGGGGEVML